jgi:hypothetical protein
MAAKTAVKNISESIKIMSCLETDAFGHDEVYLIEKSFDI